MEKLAIYGARLVAQDGIRQGGGVLIENGRFTHVLAAEEALPEGYAPLDAQGLYLAPGFIDIHTHGGGGHDYMDGTEEALFAAARTAAMHGATGVFPTTLSASQEETLAFLRMYRQAAHKPHDGAQLLGVHMEGPYFAQAQSGAQDPRYLTAPSPAAYEPLLEAADGHIRRWSAAPELPGAHAFGEALASRGIVASMGHSDALAEDVLTAVDHGYSHITHLYSGMTLTTRIQGFRHGGMVEAALLDDRITVEIICDGKHLPPELLRLVYKCKGPGRIALITDSMRAAGQDCTESILGSLKDGQRVLVQDGVAWMPSLQAFAGSIATCDRLIRTAVQLAGFPLWDAVTMLSATPARIMGIEGRKGRIAPGCDADCVLFDDDIRIRRTIIGGRSVYQV